MVRCGRHSRCDAEHWYLKIVEKSVNFDFRSKYGSPGAVIIAVVMVMLNELCSALQIVTRCGFQGAEML